MREENDNTKIKALIKLGLWVIFIVLLVVISGIGDNNNNNIDYPSEDNSKEQEEVAEVTYQDMLDRLNDNYKYSYEIKVGENIYYYNGSKNGNRESGNRLLNEEYLYYFLENGYVYQVNNGGLDKIETIYDVNINIDYLDITKIKESINNVEYTLVNNSYNYTLEDKQIIIYTDKENISKIEIFVVEDYYKLEFSDIGKVSEIAY